MNCIYYYILKCIINTRKNVFPGNGCVRGTGGHHDDGPLPEARQQQRRQSHHQAAGRRKARPVQPVQLLHISNRS